jgi:hypothetical protein
MRQRAQNGGHGRCKKVRAMATTNLQSSIASSLQPREARVRFNLTDGSWPVLSVDSERFSIGGSSLHEGAEVHATFAFWHCVTVTVAARAERPMGSAQTFRLQDPNPEIATVLLTLAELPLPAEAC